MKDFNEWAKEKQLLNELSPELLFRAGNVAKDRYEKDKTDRTSGIRSGELKPNANEVGRNFFQGGAFRVQLRADATHTGGYNKATARYDNSVNTVTNIAKTNNPQVFRIFLDAKNIPAGERFISAEELILVADLKNKKLYSPMLGNAQFQMDLASVRKVINIINSICQTEGKGLSAVYNYHDLPFFRLRTRE